MDEDQNATEYYEVDKRMRKIFFTVLTVKITEIEMHCFHYMKNKEENLWLWPVGMEPQNYSPG